jgi:uncharacterized cupin superfamily protein
MSDSVIRLDPGFARERMAAEPNSNSDGLLSGRPNMRNHGWWVSVDGRASVGIWTCDTYNERLASFPYDELIGVVEGSFTIKERGQPAQTFEAGDAFLVRGGTPCEISVRGPFRKLFMNYQADRST